MTPTVNEKTDEQRVATELAIGCLGNGCSIAPARGTQPLCIKDCLRAVPAHRFRGLQPDRKCFSQFEYSRPMARSTQSTRNITVAGTQYHWRASGNDGYISITIWPKGSNGPPISCNLSYHESWKPVRSDVLTSNGDQIVVTNRLIQRILTFAIESHGYDPCKTSGSLDLRCVDSDIDLTDAIRAERKP